MVDARYGRGGTTPRGLQRALGGHLFTGGAAAGEAACSSTADDGPTLGVRFGMTGGLVVDGDRGARPSALRARGVRRQVGAGPRDVRRRGPSAAARSPALRFARAGARRGPAGSRCAHRDVARAPGGPGEQPGAGGHAAPLKARLMDQERLAGSRQPPGRRDPVAGRPRPATTGPAQRRRAPHPAQGAARHPAPAGAARRIAHGRAHGGAPRRGRCPKDGAELRAATVGGRTTWWCPQHQQ